MLLLLALICLASQVSPRETGFFPVAQSSVEARVLIDARIEVPAIYSSQTALPTPPPGAAAQFQVFAPETAGLRAYSILVAFQDSAGTFLDRFEITEARTDLRAPDIGAAGGTPGLTSLALTSPVGSKGPIRSMVFVAPWTIAPSGLIAVVTLRARQTIDIREPMVLEVRVTVEADIPPDRLIQYTGYAPITWQ